MIISMDLMQGVSASYILHAVPVGPPLVHLELKLVQNAVRILWYVGWIPSGEITDITIAYLAKEVKEKSRADPIKNGTERMNWK